MFEQLGIGGVLSFDGAKGVAGMRAASAELGKLSGGFSGFASKLAGLALGGGMLFGLERVAHFALDAREQFEDMETTLGTTFNVLSGGHHIEQSFQLAKKEMREIDFLATKSPGQARDLLDIYKQIVGPMSTMGMSLDQVRSTTLSASIAAKGLGVSFQDMGEEMFKLFAGNARQMDRIFVLMRSQGLIKETAGEWNALSSEVRKAKIDVIMKKYMESADKVGSTFSATKESLIDVLKITGRSAIDATFERMKKGMAAVRDFFFNNRESIERAFDGIGESLGNAIDATVDFIRGFIQRFSEYWEPIKEPILEAWDEIKNAFQLVASAYLDWIDTSEGTAKTSGQLMGDSIGSIAMVAAKVVGFIGDSIAFAIYLIAHLQYYFEVAGQRIGETFASIWMIVVDLFKGVYDVVIMPIHQIVDAIYRVIDAIASTSLGAAALKKMGIDPKALTGSLKYTLENGALSYAKLDNPFEGFGKLPEDPDEKALKDQVNKLSANHHVNVNVKVENKNDLKLNANGRELARVQAQAQLELKERAGANDTPWQRRAAVVHAATYAQGGR